MIARSSPRWLAGLVLAVLVPEICTIALAADAPKAQAVEAPKAQPAGAITRGQRIFMTGHSFHMPMRPLIPELAKLAGIEGQEMVGVQGLGGSRVIQIWDIPDEKNNAKAALTAGKVDVFTTSPHRKHPDPGLDNFVELGLKHNHDLRVLAQLSWLPYDNDAVKGPGPKPEERDAMTAEKLLEIHAKYYEDFAAQLRAINDKHGRPVIFSVPVSRAVIALREKARLGQAPGIAKQSELFNDGIGHTGPVITALNAYCHFAVIYRRSPVGLGVPNALNKVPEEHRANLNRLLQELAWEAVTGDPLSGVTAK